MFCKIKSLLFSLVCLFIVFGGTLVAASFWTQNKPIESMCAMFLVTMFVSLRESLPAVFSEYRASKPAGGAQEGGSAV